MIKYKSSNTSFSLKSKVLIFYDAQVQEANLKSFGLSFFSCSTSAPETTRLFRTTTNVDLLSQESDVDLVSKVRDFYLAVSLK